MKTRCTDCGETYDDADRTTICPHELIMPAADLVQKKAGLALIGKDIRFAHQPEGPTHRVQAVGWNGMVKLADMSGEFAPHLFVPASTPVDLFGMAFACMSRDDRQTVVGKWCAAAFGADHASSLPQRGVRLLEEAIELYQAAGGTPAMAHRLVDFIFDRPAGTVPQEMGGVAVTLLALANAAGQSADAEEVREIARVLAKPVSHFTARNDAKNAAGFDTSKED